ncbi:P-loop containing nucleoside triphosphate hydrolase protein [Pisolithus albus]|nr:P-loop containing nucleoside triphosphate hydrolase protein [Pisolithus albus]
MAKRPRSRALGDNSTADANTKCSPSAPLTSPGNVIPTSLTGRSPLISPKDFRKAHGIGASISATPHDIRARGLEGGLRSTFKPLAAPPPLPRKSSSHADNTTVHASSTALRDGAGSRESIALSGQTTQPSRPAVPRNDSLESQTVASEVTQSPRVPSSLRRGSTVTVTTDEAHASGFASADRAGLHEPDLASRQVTKSQMGLTHTLADDARSCERDIATRQSTQPPRASSPLAHGGTPDNDSTGVLIQGPETSLGVRCDELDCVPNRATEIAPTPERQNHERLCDNLSKEVYATDDEPPSKEKQETHQQPLNGAFNQGLTDLPEDEVREVVLDDLTTEDIIIAIMGPTGTGKSSFVAKATNRGEEGVGHLLVSHTSEIRATKCIIEKSNVVLVDTPGFDDTHKADLQILESISDWLNKTYKQGTLLSGILYFHRISDIRMAGTPLKNLRVFRKLCGNKAMSQVILVTTMWDEVDESVGNERLEELEGDYWKAMIAQGSTTYRYVNTLESSRELLSQLVESKRREVRLQKQTANKHLQLRETDAGQELYSRLDEIAEKRAEILARITAQSQQAGDQAMADDLRKQYETLKAELNQTRQQMQSLKLTSVKRAATYIRKTLRVHYHFFAYVLLFILG